MRESKSSVSAKKKSMKVITKHHRNWGDEEISPITFEDLARYLGVDIQPDGNIRLIKSAPESNPKN